ncbi:MAG: DUF2917 domain-containing protein [Proteobacteria bacterium]|nr:DUF2917 domain-containing protein [Pseudomonadota bacterium]
MSCFETGTVVSLEPHEAVTLPDVRGATLRVTRGTLWVTQDGSRHDVVLRGGDSWVVERDGATVVEAQNDALFCVAGTPALDYRDAVAGHRARRGIGATLRRLLHASDHETAAHG